MKYDDNILWEESYIDFDDNDALMTCHESGDITVTINYFEDVIIKHFKDENVADRYLRKHGFIQ